MFNRRIVPGHSVKQTNKPKFSGQDQQSYYQFPFLEDSSSNRELSCVSFTIFTLHNIVTALDQLISIKMPSIKEYCFQGTDYGLEIQHCWKSSIWKSIHSVRRCCSLFWNSVIQPIPTECPQDARHQGGHLSCPHSVMQAKSLPPSCMLAENLWTSLAILPRPHSTLGGHPWLWYPGFVI